MRALIVVACACVCMHVCMCVLIGEHMLCMWPRVHESACMCVCRLSRVPAFVCACACMWGVCVCMCVVCACVWTWPSLRRRARGLHRALPLRALQLFDQRCQQRLGSAGGLAQWDACTRHLFLRTLKRPPRVLVPLETL